MADKMEMVLQLTKVIETGRAAEKQLRTLLGEGDSQRALTAAVTSVEALNVSPPAVPEPAEGTQFLKFGGGKKLPYVPHTKQRTTRSNEELQQDALAFLRNNPTGWTQTALTKELRTGSYQLGAAIKELKKQKLVHTKVERTENEGGRTISLPFLYVTPKALNGHTKTLFPAAGAST